MNPLREAAQQALDWLYDNDILHPTKVSEDLRAALAQQDESVQEPVQEPVAKCIDDICSEHLGRVEAFDHLPRGTLLYATPPQRTMVPLTEEEIDALPWNGSPRQFARSVEKAVWEKNNGQA